MMVTDQGLHCARSCFSVVCSPALEEVQWQLSWACSCARSCFSTQMLSSLSIPELRMVDTRGAAAWRTHKPVAYRQEQMHGDGSTLGYSGFDSAMLLHTTMELFLTQMQADGFRKVSVKHMATYRCSTKYITNVEEGSWVLVLLLVLASGKSEELLDRGMIENKLNLKGDQKKFTRSCLAEDYNSGDGCSQVSPIVRWQESLGARCTGD